MRVVVLLFILVGNLYAAEPSLEMQILELRKNNMELYRQVLELSYEKNQRALEDLKVEYDKKKAEEEKRTKVIK